jgi:hypothetical protein
MRKPLAIFTIVKDEPEFLPVWCDHYINHGYGSDLFILDNHSDDNLALEDAVARDIRVVSVFNDEVDHDWMLKTVQDFQHFLLNSYEAVLFVEVDEFVLTDPASHYTNLVEYAADMVQPVVRCTGFEVVHQIGEEDQALIQSRMLEHRGWWYPTTQYSKPLLSRVPMMWCKGFHESILVPHKTISVDPNLLLVHLHKLDYAVARRRLERFRNRKWSKADIAAGAGFQNRCSDEEFEKWFRTNVDNIGAMQPLEPIPQSVRDVL